MGEKDRTKEEIGAIIQEAISAAREELKTYPNMPEHYSQIMKYPNMDAKGYFSEIDMDIDARLRKCDTYAKSRTIYDRALYQHVRQEVDLKGSKLKRQVREIAKEHRILTRAARLCKDEDAKKAILSQANKLKESQAVKDYNLLITGLEAYSGAGYHKMENETIKAYERLIGHVTDGAINFSGKFTDGEYRELPDQIKVEFRNMDEYFEQFRQSHPEAKGKTKEELGALYPSYSLFEKTVMQYGKDALEDTLDSCFGTLDDRLDFVIINGQTLREMVAENDRIEGRKEEEKRTPQELNEISCNLMMAALKAGARIEAFMAETEEPGKKTLYAETVPIVCNPPEERVTMSFWEKFMSIFGFHKEKAQKLKEQEEMDRKMEACKQRVREKMSKQLTKEEIAAGKRNIIINEPMTEEKKERLKITREIAKENCDSFIRDALSIEKCFGEMEKLTYSFFPEDEKNRQGVEIYGKVDNLLRDKPLYNCVTMMMQRGIPYDEALDYTKHKELRIEIGKELKEKFPTMTAEEYDKLHIDGIKLWVEGVNDFAKKMSSEIKTIKDISEKIPKLYMGTICPQVLSMDNFEDKSKAIAACGGKEKFDAMMAKLDETSNIYSVGTTLKSTLTKYYRVLRDTPLDMTKLLADNVQRTAIIKGLQGDPPRFNPQLDTADTYIISGFIDHHPQRKILQEKANNLDREFLNDYLSNSAVNYAKTELVIQDKAVPLPKQVGSCEKGFIDVRIDIVVNGESLTGIQDLQRQINKQEGPEMDEGFTR